MLNVVDDYLVIEEKGIYSIEKFLIARRLMYWQVYLHKTVLSAENTIIKTVNRAKELILEGKEVFATPTLLFFLENKFRKKDFENNPKLLHQFAKLDDHDILSSLKQWTTDDDTVLALLSNMIINRKLLKVKIQQKPFSKQEISKRKKEVMKRLKITEEKADFFVFSEKVSNSAYSYEKAKINILMKDGSVKELKDASDQLLNEMISKKVNKFFLCYPDIKQL